MTIRLHSDTIQLGSLIEKKGDNTDEIKLELLSKFVLTESYTNSEACLISDTELEKGAELRLVTGIVLEPETPDGQGDVYSADEIRKTAHQFMADYTGQGNGLLHKSFGNKKLPIVESYIAPSDMKIGTAAVKKGAWVMTTLVLDDTVWSGVKKGDITGYSIRGRSNAKED